MIKKFNKVVIPIMFIILIWLLIMDKMAFSNDIKTWLCYYDSVFGYKIYSKFDLVVLDSHNHPPLRHDKDGNPLLISYISIGEVDKDGPYWNLAKDKSYLVKENKFWNSWIVDIRDSAWQNLVFDIAIPAIFKKGFDGLFLDTPDSCLALIEGKDKEKFKGIKTALINIIQRMKKTYPDKIIIMNRGLSILPEVASFIDFVLIEDLYSYYEESKQDYVKVDKYTQDILLKQVQRGVDVNSNMKILTLDYAKYNQKGLIRKAIAFSRNKGFIPYVSTYKLNKVFYYTLD